MMKHISFTLLLFLAIGSVAIAQPTVASGLSLEEYVNDILLGTGVEAFNIQLTGAPEQIGHLTGAEGTPCPIGEGLVLSSALATNLGGDAPDNCFGEDVPFGSGVSGDPDLLTIANSVPPLIGQNFQVSAVNDICAIEFDFIATGDSIKFNYTFGSNEYLTWVNSSFNDVFAFFLSGPGLAGPFSAPDEYPDGAINIAQLPGTDPPLPITISSVNNVLNSEFYIDNPFPNQGICQNGFTVALQASAQVICGETYHIKLAIADGSDTALESVVVLEAGSFESNEVQISATIPDAPDNLPELTLLEGCVDGFVTIFRPVANEAETILVITGGTATPGDDYEALPETVEFEAGQQSVDLPINTIFDGIEEDTETITITYDYVNACDEEVTVNIVLNILDYNLPELDMDDVFLCDGEDVVVNATPTNGFGPFTYSWSTGQATPTVTVSGGGPDSIFVDIEDYCGSTAADSFRVSIPEPITFPEDTRICFGGDASMSPLGGAQPYTFIFPEDSLLFENTVFTPVFEGEYLIEYIDNCGITGSSILEVNVCETLIPNVFTPNGDGVNDLFLIEGAEGFPNSRLEVYNRWGNLVYEDDNYRNTWRAEDVADGTYYYIYFREDGEKFAGHVKIKRQR